MDLGVRTKMSGPVVQGLDWIDLKRYPILERHSPKRALLEMDCQTQLRETGICLLPGFLTKEAVRLMTEESTKLLPLSYHSRVTGNAYLTPVDKSLPDDHTFNWVEGTALGVIAYDQIPKSHALRSLYECDHLMAFIGEAMVRTKKLYRYADPMGALNISVMTSGDYLRWHFDQTDFVVSICLQDAEIGGDFEYVPFIRSKDQENYDQVKQVLLGHSDLGQHVPMEPGTLVFFEGRNSLHRVTTIEGLVPRLVALLGYDTKPGVKSSEHLQYLRYGRTL